MKEYRTNELLVRQRKDSIYLNIIAMYILRLNMVGTLFEILLGVSEHLNTD